MPRRRQVRANSEAWPGLDPAPQRQATWVQVRRGRPGTGNGSWRQSTLTPLLVIFFADMSPRVKGKKKQTGHSSLERLRGRGPAEDLDRRAGGKVRPRPEDTRAQQRRAASEVGRGLARAPPGRRTGQQARGGGRHRPSGTRESQRRVAARPSEARPGVTTGWGGPAAAAVGTSPRCRRRGNSTKAPRNQPPALCPNMKGPRGCHAKYSK